METNDTIPKKEANPGKGGDPDLSPMVEVVSPMVEAVNPMVEAVSQMVEAMSLILILREHINVINFR